MYVVLLKLSSGIVGFLLSLIGIFCIEVAGGKNVSDFFSSYSWGESFLDLWIISLFSNLSLALFQSYLTKKSLLIILVVTYTIILIVKAFLFLNFDQNVNIALYLLLFLCLLVPPGVNLILLKRIQSTEGYGELENKLLDEEDVDVEAAKSKIEHASFVRLIGLAREEYWTLAIASIALVISSACSLAQPYFFGQVINACSDEDKDKLNRVVITLSIIFIVGGIFTAIRGYLYSIVGERLVKTIRQMLFERIIRQDISFFDQNKTGELMNRLSADTTVIQSCLSVNVSMGLRSVAMIFVSTILLFVTSWKLTLVMFSVVPGLMIFVAFYGRYTKKLTKQYQNALAKAAEIGAESISNSRVMRSFGAENLECHRYFTQVDHSYQAGAKKSWAYGGFIGGMTMVGNFAIIVVIYYGAILVINDELSIGNLTSFVFYTVYIALGLGMMSNLYTDFMSAVGASERIFEILDTNPLIPTQGGIFPSIKDTSGSIKFENVEFCYPCRLDVTVLRNFTLEIKSNTTVALVGASGSGKSTVLCLLERFYDVSSGRITIDGNDIRTLDPVFLHRILAIVPQEPVLFSGSIRSNILYSQLAAHPDGSISEVSEEDIIAAAKQSNAHDFIMSFPEGYDTVVGERGIRLVHLFFHLLTRIRLSGGQKQRIAIARALLANPRILLLDEATSALDAESEKLVQDAIEKLMVNRTVIVIAHRLSTVKDANVIVMFGNGGIIASGTHEELLLACEPYEKLVKRQLTQWRDSSDLSGHNTSLLLQDEETI